MRTGCKEEIGKRRRQKRKPDRTPKTERTQGTRIQRQEGVPSMKRRLLSFLGCLDCFRFLQPTSRSTRIEKI